ncbi:putative dimethyl sulfoxide reductase, anchor subunit [Escherichia coli]|uniref:Putative dimethyl sulfoxide reductase, anchor subunit n=1 Tax=Escherichia coli TaxID=562 RepID=A0A485JEZ5_ECOLX|nr:putative dimethyl sulfoxide reductase, anchor subunit [Escherichia coli]
MGNGWHEWPLVIFTVLGQCVVGALIVSGIGWFAANNDADRQRIVRGHVFPLAVDGHRVYCLCHAPGIATASV